jgi:hypothetical protein
LPAFFATGAVSGDVLTIFAACAVVEVTFGAAFTFLVSALFAADTLSEWFFAFFTAGTVFE